MKQKKPLVTICLPYYNGEKFVTETLISIFSQTYKNTELVVGDNASSSNFDLKKEIERLVEEYCYQGNVRILSHSENLGYAGNCNSMIAIANGEYVAIYHSDDIYNDNIIEKQVDVLSRNHDVIGCFTDFSFMNSDGIERPTTFLDRLRSKKYASVSYNYPEYIESLVEHNHNPFFCPSSMVRRDVYLQVGGYDERLTYVEDQDMWSRLLLAKKNARLHIIKEKLVKYRLHPKQGSAIYSSHIRDEESPLIKHLSVHLQSTFSNDEFSAKYKNKLDRLKAIDALRQAFFMIVRAKHNDFYRYAELIKRSREFDVLDVRIGHQFMYSLFQNLPVKMSFFLLKTAQRLG